MSLTVKVLAGLLSGEILTTLHGPALLSLVGMSARVLLSSTGVLASGALMSTGVSTGHYKYRKYKILIMAKIRF